MIRTIFFDFGNVVAHFDHGRAIARLRSHTDMPPVELALALYGNPVEDAYERGDIPTDEYVRLAKQAGRLTCPDEAFLAAFADIFTINPEVSRLIPRLAGQYRLVLASNTNEAHFQQFTNQFAGVLAHFNMMCPSHHARYRKPEPRYFEYCQRFAEAEPGECLFINDLAVNLEGAARHGWQTFLYRPDVHLAKELAAMGIA